MYIHTKKHFSTLLTAVFLIGVALIAAHFNSRNYLMSAQAVTSEGQAPAANQNNIYGALSLGGWVGSAAISDSVIYSADLRKADGSLISGGDILHPGDSVNVLITLNAGFNVVGLYRASPPMPWVESFVEIFDINGFEGVVAPNNSQIFHNLCRQSAYQTGVGCYVSAAVIPKVALSPAGLSCEKLVPTNDAVGLRTYKSACTIQNGFNIVHLKADIGISQHAPLDFAAEGGLPWGVHPNNVNHGPFNFSWESSDPFTLQDFELTWNIPDSDNCVSSWGGNVPNAGTTRLIYSANSTISMTCHDITEDMEVSYNANVVKGLTTSHRTQDFLPQSFSWDIDVNPIAPQPPTLTFTGNPTSITQGNSSTLEWSLSGGPVTNCTATGGWPGSKNKNGGTESVSPSVTTDYFLECVGPGGSSGKQQVTINVNPVILTFTLTVNSTGASSVSITSSTGHGGTSNYNKSGLASGTSVSLTAPSVPGFTFNGWSGDCTGGNPCNVNMNSNKTATANYVAIPLPDYSLTSNPSSIFSTISGSGSVKSSNSTISVNPFNGFNSTVSLSAIFPPELVGATASFTPTSLSSPYSSGSTFNVTVPANTAGGAYTITIFGAGGGLPSRSTTVTLNVALKDPGFREVLRPVFEAFANFISPLIQNSNASY